MSSRQPLPRLVCALSQIPANIHVATTGHTRRLRAPVASYDFLQMKPELFTDGVQWSETPRSFRMSTVEKALFDTLYISTRRNRRFARLPAALGNNPADIRQRLS